MAKIVLFSVRKTAYGVQHFLMEEYQKCFRELGHECTLLGFESHDSLTVLAEELQKGSPDLILSFNNICLEICDSVSSQNIYNLLDVPFCGYLLDHPAYHIHRIKGDYRTLSMACVDSSHIPFIQDTFALDAFYVPHAACRVSETQEPLKKRSMRIFFAGTYTDPLSELKCFDHLQDGTQDTIGQIIEHAEAKPLKPLMNIIHEELKALELEDEAAVFEFGADLFVPIDRFIRANRRLKVLDVLTRAGISVDLCGGWDASPFAKHHRVHAAMPFQKMMGEMLGQSQIVLNILPNYVEGSHERLLTGMLTGALGLTDANVFSQKHFVQGEDILSFDWNHLEELPDMLMDVMDKPLKLEEIAMSGQEKVRQGHTWKHRLELIIKHFNLGG